MENVIETMNSVEIVVVEEELFFIFLILFSYAFS